MINRQWLLLVLAWPTPACTHDFWIEPSSFRSLTGATIAVGLRVGQDFVGDPVPYLSGAIARFFLRQDGKDTTLYGSDGAEPAAFLRTSDSTTAIIAYSSNGYDVELPAERFEVYLRQHGLNEIIAERVARHERTKPGRERFYRYAKALLSGAGPSQAATQPLGFAYEIVPDIDPTAASAAFRARVLYEGEPLAGALVEALFRDDPSVRLSALSDPQGMVALNLHRAGVWLVKSVHMERAGFFCSCDWESSWASLTFETPAASQ